MFLFEEIVGLCGIETRSTFWINDMKKKTRFISKRSVQPSAPGAGGKEENLGGSGLLWTLFLQPRLTWYLYFKIENPESYLFFIIINYFLQSGSLWGALPPPQKSPHQRLPTARQIFSST